MTMEKHDDSGVPAHIRQLLRDQQEANENLVLAMIHAQELRDQAESATHLAQEALKSAEVAQKIAQAIAEDFAKRELELHAAAALREQLLAIVGHDLRNPLNAIGVAAQILEKHVATSTVDVKLVEGIRHSAHRMGRMIEQLLEFARTRLGSGLELDLKSTNFGSTADLVGSSETGSAPTRALPTPHGGLVGPPSRGCGQRWRTRV